jgi:hypothetical protein
MPTPRKHADHAARQRAYLERKRQESVTDASQEASSASVEASRPDVTHEPSVESLRDLSRNELRRILNDPKELVRPRSPLPASSVT